MPTGQSDAALPIARNFEATGQFLERYVQRLIEGPGAETTEDLYRTVLNDVYKHMYPGCRACGDEGYHAARASMLTELIQTFTGHAGRLFGDNQDKEAYYLRDKIVAPMKDLHKQETDLMMKFVDGFHSCTLTGLSPTKKT
jgi:hypothetical protein